jgi:hypothetical protein
MRPLAIRLIGTLAVITVAAAALVGSSCQWTFNSGTGTGSGTGIGGGSVSGDASAIGVWSGKDSVSGLGMTALINSAGQAAFIRGDGVQFVGTVQVSGTSLAVTVSGYSDFSSRFSDGSTFGIGTLNGSVTTGTTLTATLDFTTSAGTALKGNWSLSFEALSNDGSSTAAISGNYTDQVTGTVLSISSSGVMTSQNAANGCVLNGSMSSTDTSHDVYEVAFTYGSCTGTYAVLNTVSFKGLATLNPALSPAQITLAVAGASSTNQYGIVQSLNGS